MSHDFYMNIQIMTFENSYNKLNTLITPTCETMFNLLRKLQNVT